MTPRGLPAAAALSETIELQRMGCELAGSALYSRVLAGVADDVARRGPCHRLLDPHAGAPVGDAVLLRLLAGVHELVLGGRADELATHYPSVGGAPGPGLVTAFLAVVEGHGDALAEAMERGVQTNEPGRSAALLCGLLPLADGGLPLRLLEIGASAGLNLQFDGYHYRSGSWTFGPSDSPLRFVDAFVGRPPRGRTALTVGERRGCDLDPLDPAAPGDVRRLRSFVWPDQIDRLERLDAALQVAGAAPLAVERREAGDWLREHLADRVPGVVTVVTHSIVFQYLPAASKRRVLSLVEEAGRRATAEAPLAWLRMEPGGDRAEVRLTTWPSARTELVATSGYHGPPVAPT